MKNNLKLLLTLTLVLISTFSFGQILKGTGLVYTNGVPTHTPRTSTESEYAVDVSTGKGDLYLWNRTSNTWKLIPEGIEVINDALVPSTAPGYGQARFRVNTVPTLYFWTGVTWIPLTGNAYTAGTGINITGNVITNTGDLSNTNEIQYIDTLRLTGNNLEISLYNDGLPYKSVSLGSLATNIYTSNGSITDQTRVVSIPGNLVFSNNSASVGERFSVGYDNGVSSTNSFEIKEGTGISLSSSENNIFFEGQTSFRDVVSPSALTGNVNNYTGLNGANVGILSSNGAYNITGIDNGVHGRILFLFNNGSFDLTLKNQSGSSSVENRFYMGSDFVLKADTGAVIIMYDTLIPAWRAFKMNGGSASGVDVQTLSIDSALVGSVERFEVGISGGNSVSFDVGIPAGLQNLSITGSGPTYDIAISGGTPVTIQGAGIITLSESPANTLVITGTQQIQQLDTFFITNAIISASLSLDAVPAKTLDITESVQDIAGAMVTGNTETGIAVTYDDTNGKFDFVTDNSSILNSLTADNGLTKNTATNVRLGGTLVQNTTIAGGTLYNLTLTGNYSTVGHNGILEVVQSAALGRAVYATSSTGSTIYGVSSATSAGTLVGINNGATTGYGVYGEGNGTSGAGVYGKGVYGLYAESPSGYGVFSTASGVAGAYYGSTAGSPLFSGIMLSNTTNTVRNNLVLQRATTGTAADGIGQSIEFDLENSTGASNASNIIISKFTTATGGNETSELSFQGRSAGAALATRFTMAGTGAMSFNAYGSGTFTGTPTYALQVDASGNIIEGTVPTGINIYNADGTQDDADRLFTQDSTRTFAMGQFTSVSTPTWGRGYYYDPSTSNGVRLLNKDGGNTTTAKLELDPQNITLGSTHLTSDGRLETYTVSEDTRVTLLADRTSDTYGALSANFLSNSNEEIIALTQAGKTTAPSVSMYLGDGYSSSTYAKYASRAWGVQSILSGGGFDWIQVLLPDTGTDSTGNNLGFYNRKYFWSNSVPSPTSGDTSIHVWIGNGTTTTPVFVSLSDLLTSSVNIYNSDGTVDNREIEMNGFMNWVDNDGDAEFNVSVGSLAGANLFLTQTESKINYFDAGGINTLAADGSGIEISTSDGVDDILISSSSDLNIIADLTTIASAVAHTNIITPTALSANTDNWNPTGLSTAYEIRVSTTTPINITGIVAQENGREIVLRNVGNHPFTLKNNVTSTAANRFLIGYDYNVPAEGMVKIVYDDNDDRWFVSSPLSLGTGSGRLAGGRAQDIYWSYQTDTLKDFALGYFTNGTTDDRVNYGKFGMHIDGDGGFNIAAKETYIKGSHFNQLGTSFISSKASSFEMAGLSRTSTGASSSTRIDLVGITLFNSTNNETQTEYYVQLADVVDNYDDLTVGAKKQLRGVLQSKNDYAYMYQGGGHSGADTSAISVWMGIPQFSDTVGSIFNSNVRAISKERGFGVQSLFNHNAGGVQASFKYDWIKVYTGSVPADTAIHSSSKDGITFYGNKYEIPNETPTADTSVMVWTSPFNSFFINIDDIKGGGSGGNGIYGGDGNIPTGGSEATQDNIGETVRFNMNTGNTTTGESFIITRTDDATHRYIVMRGAEDSLRIFRFNDENYMQSYSATLNIATDEQLTLAGDSLELVEGIAETKTTVRFLLGATPGNFVKRIDGNAATQGDAMVSNATDWIVSPVMERTVTTSGAGTLNLGTSTCYVFTGTTTTWTLPTVAGNTNRTYFIKNRGSGAITLNTNAGGNDIYTTSAVNTITINAGESVLLWNDGTYFLEMY